MLSARKTSEYLQKERLEVMEGVPGGVATEVTERLQERIHNKIHVPHLFEGEKKCELETTTPICITLNNVDNISMAYSFYKLVGILTPCRPEAP